jgi:hypothetical protein
MVRSSRWMRSVQQDVACRSAGDWAPGQQHPVELLAGAQGHTHQHAEGVRRSQTGAQDHNRVAQHSRSEMATARRPERTGQQPEWSM